MAVTPRVSTTPIWREFGSERASETRHFPNTRPHEHTLHLTSRGIMQPWQNHLSDTRSFCACRKSIWLSLDKYARNIAAILRQVLPLRPISVCICTPDRHDPACQDLISQISNLKPNEFLGWRSIHSPYCWESHSSANRPFHPRPSDRWNCRKSGWLARVLLPRLYAVALVSKVGTLMVNSRLRRGEHVVEDVWLLARWFAGMKVSQPPALRRFWNCMGSPVCRASVWI